MGSCIQQIEQQVDEEPLVEMHHNSQSSTSLVYQLNDLRSLEGVARLWSDKMQSQTTHNTNNLAKLQGATSVRVQGNRSRCNHPFAPICISTYYFVHAPNASDQPNLLHSHSAPPNLTRAALKGLRNDKKKKKENITINEDEDNIVIMDLPETMAVERKFSAVLSPIASPSLASHLQPPDSPQYMHTYGAAPMMPMVPVFSFSGSVASENIVIGPLELDDNTNNGFHLNIGLDDIETKHCSTTANESQWVSVKHTYSNRNVFKLADTNLTTDDFMEYDTTSAFSIGVGAGASGIVKKAFHFTSCKMVAIKQCRSKQEHEINAFKKEAKLYKKFSDNECITDIIGFGKGDINNELLMALEYMDCGSVESIKIHEKYMDIKERELIVGHIALNVLLALNELHHNLYVHNDLKPANILANKYGEIKLSDFGTMNRLQSLSDYLTKNNGTQRYQPPEKTILEIKYNQKADIWSLGITLYELLFGIGEHDSDITYATNPPYVNAKNTNLSKHCCDFINKCLTFNQTDRPCANELLKHNWFTKHIKCVELNKKWPMLLSEDELITNGRNEDLLFMISALIIYYSTKDFDNADNGSLDHILHRRVSVKPKGDQNNATNDGDHGNEEENNNRIYSDEERISNIAKYALCSKDTVMDRIKVTVSYIKSQLK